jgi:hypothetical protein
MATVTFVKDGQCFLMAFRNFEKPSAFMANSRENVLLPLLSIPCAVERSFDTSIPTNNVDKTTPPCSSSFEKTGTASQPNLHRDKGSKTQSTYYGFGRQGTHYKKDSMTQVFISSSCLPV